MPFKIATSRDEKFESFDEVVSFAEEERNRVYRLPLKGIWSKGAKFVEDKGLDQGDSILEFNGHGFQGLCNKLGLDPNLPNKLREPGLASRLLNDRMEAQVDSGELGNIELICDEENNQVIGLVSSKYVGYSNAEFIKDVMYALDPVNNNGALFLHFGDFEFREAYSLNSRLFLRIKSKTVHGVVQGRGGAGEDVTEIGLQLSNTMAGGHAVMLSWYLFRLLCANGLVAPVGGGAGRVIHSGTEKGFQKRLWNAADGAFKGLRKAKKMVETLGAIEFNAVKLAEHADLKLLYSIIPGRDLKDEAAKLVVKEEIEESDKKRRNCLIAARVIEEIPLCLGGREALAVFNSPWRESATMFDFINVYTEHAKTLKLTEKVEAEMRAGELAAWIANNKRKFS